MNISKLKNAKDNPIHRIYNCLWFKILNKENVFMKYYFVKVLHGAK